VAAGTPSVAPERTAASNALQAAREALTAASCEGTAAEVARAIEVAVEAARDAKELAAIANRKQDGNACMRARNNRRNRRKPDPLAPIFADLAAAEGSLGQLADAVAAGTPSVAPERTAASNALQAAREALTTASCEGTAAEVARAIEAAVEAARDAKELAAIANRKQDGKACKRARDNRRNRRKPDPLAPIFADLAAAEGSLGQLADAVAAGTPSVAPERTAASNALQAAREALTAASCEGTAAGVARAIEVAVEAARDAKELAAIANRKQDGKACKRARDNILHRRNRRKPDPLAPIFADLAAAEGSLGQLADAVAAGTPLVAPERTAASNALQAAREALTAESCEGTAAEVRVRVNPNPLAAAKGSLGQLADAVAAGTPSVSG